MTIPKRRTAAGPLHALMTFGVLGEETDARLLELYRSRRPGGDEAFRILLERHGAMVHSVCRSLVRDTSEADDAFQAVFVVLVRHAEGVRKAESLGPWLHGVAIRVARRARRRSRSRASRLRVVDPANLDRVVGRAGAPDHSAMIHAEIDRLPDRDRRPLVLCGLEGLSYEQAARTLGVSEPTLRGRLHRARKRLEARLKKQDVAVPTSLVPAAPPALLVETVLAQAAGVSLAAIPVPVSSLAKGAILAMTLSSLKPIVFSSLATLGLVGSVVLAQQAGPSSAESHQQAPASKPEEGRKSPPVSTPKPPRLLTPEEREARNKLIQAALENPIDLDFPEGIDLEDLLKHVKKVTSSADDDGIPFYVNPVGLGVTQQTMSSVRMTLISKEKPLGEALKGYLGTLNLGYVIKDGYVLIDSRAATAEARIDVLEAKLDALIKRLDAAPFRPSIIEPTPEGLIRKF
ncbi:RNA polymerase sigma factor [Paludisphaera mucosa]|uniref:Sigma-70 family RNA polymerase sigma factor n=1 Tax=Paludisphaera mucosa TaxID=3030827 RepID=A0ABT6FG11_9BACT|nr:sigma-70 family RNA polymerase sigma factor [Paludisphaera mucosa]MDG3006526.1 sigma-70 family RNA polymerase sigma factor [Paludisphaera mucosa]